MSSSTAGRALELLGVCRFEAFSRYRETYVGVLDDVKMPELDRYNYYFLGCQNCMPQAR
jgi:hypothetical protein